MTKRQGCSKIDAPSKAGDVVVVTAEGVTKRLLSAMQGRAAGERTTSGALTTFSTDLEKYFKVSLNHTAIAQATGTDLSYISRIMSGKRRSSVTTLRQIARFLKLSSVDELCDVLGVNGGVQLRKYQKRGKEHTHVATATEAGGGEGIQHEGRRNEGRRNEGRRTPTSS